MTVHVAIYNRLMKAGLRGAVDTYMDEVRKRRKAAGDNRAAANQAAEDAMKEVFGPVLERWEQQQAKAAQPNEPALSGCAAPADLEGLLDPDYTETDPGKWLRDGLLWTAAEIRRVVIDTDEGTTVDLTRARTRPPTAWAVFCVEAFARKKPDARGELIAKVLPFATRSHEPRPAAGREQGGGFLDDIG